MRSLLGTLLAGVLFLGGCAVKKVPPTHTYALKMPAAETTGAILRKPLCDALKIVVTDPGRLARTTAIYYRRGEQLQPYAYHRWAETPAVMVEKRALLTLQNAHIANHVLTGESRGGSGLVLEVSLLDFSQHFDEKGSRGRILLQATLVDTKTGEVFRSRLFEAVAPAPTDDATGGVAALGRATEKAMEELTEWLTGSRNVITDH